MLKANMWDIYILHHRGMMLDLNAYWMVLLQSFERHVYSRDVRRFRCMVTGVSTDALMQERDVVQMSMRYC